MKITTEQLPNSQIALVVQPDEEQVEQALRKAATKVAQRYNIAGFRKGKAPYAAIVRAFGREALLEQAAEEMGDQIYRQALEESGLQPIAPGMLEDITFDPLTYRLILSMTPRVDLGDYRSVRVERTPVIVSDEAVDERLETLREEQAEWTPVEEAALGDLLTMSITGSAGEDAILTDDAFELVLEEESEDFPPGFDAKFLGAKAGDQVAFDITYPEDWPSERSGQTAHFEATILSVKRNQLPELNDDFAPLIGDFDTLDALRANIREGLAAEQQEEAEISYANEVLQQILAGAVLEYPPVLVDDAVERMMQEQEQNMRRVGLPMSEFLRLTGQTADDMRAQLRAQAEDQLRIDLALDQLAADEHIHVADAEIDARIEELVSNSSAEDTAGLREFLAGASGRHALMHDIERRNTVARMIAIGEGNAPELVAHSHEEAEAPAAE